MIPKIWARISSEFSINEKGTWIICMCIVPEQCRVPALNTDIIQLFFSSYFNMQSHNLIKIRAYYCLGMLKTFSWFPHLCFYSLYTCLLAGILCLINRADEVMIQDSAAHVLIYTKLRLFINPPSLTNMDFQLNNVSVWKCLSRLSDLSTISSLYISTTFPGPGRFGSILAYWLCLNLNHLWYPCLQYQSSKLWNSLPKLHPLLNKARHKVLE